MKSEEPLSIDEVNRRIDGALLVLLCLIFLTAIRWQNIFFVVGCMVAIVIGQAVRFLRLPRDIRAHLVDSGRRKR